MRIHEKMKYLQGRDLLVGSWLVGWLVGWRLQLVEAAVGWLACLLFGRATCCCWSS